MKNKLRKNYKFILGMIFGIVISASSVYAATVLTSKEVSYDNTNSKLSSTNFKDAIDEVNEKATTKLEEAEKSCPEGYICTIEPLSFKNDSWTTISANVKAGKATQYKVGDTKEIDMGDLGTHTVRVSNTSSCTNGETSETACGFVVEFADIISRKSMNSTYTNVGGWPASKMRTYVNETVYNALPNDLQNVIATTKVISASGISETSNFASNDKLYLLSTKEVWNGGTGYDTAEAETRQLDYYKNKVVTKSNYSEAIKQYNGSNANWWLRSVSSYNTGHFWNVRDNGAWKSISPDSEYGVAPAFRIAQ